jgi:phage N-6-adenine-methyltransferase
MSKSAGFTHDNVANKSVDWYTPPWIFDALGLEFNLDPCAPVGGVSWIPATKHYSEIDDGLKQPWRGSVWLNPPYGKFTTDWLAKMHQHRNGVALVFARTDCRWFHDYVMNADAILFLKGRIKFVDGLGATGGNGAGAGSMLIAWGDEAVCALNKMSAHGAIWMLGAADDSKQMTLELAA